MITVVLDSNILHQEGLSSRNMQLMLRLIKASHIEIYVPELVKREFLTRSIMSCEEKVQKAYNELSNVAKKVIYDSDAQENIVKVRDSTRLIKLDIKNHINLNFEKWVDEYNVKIIQFNPSIMIGVLDDYFSGAGVFRKPKSREDIPDAIINAGLDELKEQKESLVVITNDGVFNKHLKESDGIDAYDCLADFLNNDNNKKLFEAQDSEAVENLNEFFNSTIFSNHLLEYLQNSNDELDWVYLEGDEILGKDVIGVDSFGVTVEFPKADYVRIAETSASAWLAGSKFSIKFSFITFATLAFNTDFSNYEEVEDVQGMSLYSMNGDGVCEMIQNRLIRFYGSIEINIGQEMTVETLEKYCRELGNTDNPVNIKINIQKAELLPDEETGSEHNTF